MGSDDAADALWVSEGAVAGANPGHGEWVGKFGHGPSLTLYQITGLSYVQLRQDSYPAVGQLGVAVEGGVEPYPGVFNEGDNLAKPSRKDLVKGVTFTNVSQYDSSTRWFEAFGRGGQDVHWTASAEQSWISLSASHIYAAASLSLH